MTKELIEVNPNTGLPADLSNIRCVEAVLMPLDLDEIQQEIENYFKNEDIPPEHPITLNDFHDGLLKGFWDYIPEHYEFRDWNYEIVTAHLWDAGQVFVELRAQKLNTDIEMVLSVKEFSEDDLVNQYGGVVPERGYRWKETPTADTYAIEFFELFQEAQKAIVEWNTIATYNIPVFEERPPFEELRDEALKGLQEDFLEMEWEDAKEYPEYYDQPINTFDQFMEACWIDHTYIAWALAGHGYKAFGQFMIHYVELTENGCTLLKMFLSIDDIEVDILLFEREFYVGYEEWPAYEVDDWIDSIHDHAEDVVREWNRVMSGEEW